MSEQPKEPALARMRRLDLSLRLVMALNGLVLLAILGWCLWKLGRLIGSW